MKKTNQNKNCKRNYSNKSSIAKIHILQDKVD